jgi:hypothetical protein
MKSAFRSAESSNTPPRLGGIAPQTSTLLPVAHLRSDGADARNPPAFTLQHAVPEDANVPNARLQKGWNQFVTP